MNAIAPIIVKDPSEWQAQMAQHIAADELIQRTYWDVDEGKGCFIGCSVHGRDPQILEDRIGLPIMVTRLAEAIFEGLPERDAIAFTKRISAPGLIREGQNLSLVGWQMQHWILTDANVNPGIHDPTVAAVVSEVAHNFILPLSKGGTVSANAARSAANAARSAESAAWNLMAEKLISLIEAAPLIEGKAQ